MSIMSKSRMKNALSFDGMCKMLLQNEMKEEKE